MINGITNWLDRGFCFDVTAEPPEDFDVDDVAEVDEECERLEKSRLFDV